MGRAKSAQDIRPPLHACGSLRNVNYKRGGPIALSDDDAGVTAMTKLPAENTIILLCLCANLRTCHRRVVSSILRERIGADERGDRGIAASSGVSQLGLW